VASPDFFFSLSFSGVPAPDAQVLRDVVACVLEHAGSSKDHAPAVASGIEQAVKSAGSTPCDVSFAARSGSLDVLVSANGRCLWQTSEHLC
jgi:hypothetical protein